MRVLVLQHIACEHPGAFSEVLDERGVEAVPVELDAPERELVREAVGDGRAFLGVCLGVQLLAASLGGEIRPSEPPEVGLLPVELTDEGRRDPLFAGLDDTLVSLQWHGDTFELPEGSVRLARSELVPNQAFRFGERAYGVQFHLEVTAEMAREWANVPAYRQSLAENLGEERGAAFLREVEQRAAELHPPARRLFENWLDLAATA
jgi:GMP synthase-like glutamine amidotransferase